MRPEDIANVAWHAETSEAALALLAKPTTNVVARSVCVSFTILQYSLIGFWLNRLGCDRRRCDLTQNLHCGSYATLIVRDFGFR